MNLSGGGKVGEKPKFPWNKPTSLKKSQDRGIQQRQASRVESPGLVDFKGNKKGKPKNLRND